MEFKENPRVCKDFEFLHRKYEANLRKNNALKTKAKSQVTEEEALKEVNDLMGQGQDTGSVPETAQTQEVEQTTDPEDCESFCQVFKALSQKHKALFMKTNKMIADMEGLEKKINGLLSQRAQATSVSEKTGATQLTETKRLPIINNKETQTLNVLQEVEDANKLLLQEKEAWEAERKKLQQEITILTKQKCEGEEKARQAERDKIQAQREMDVIAMEGNMNGVVWSEEQQTLQRERAIQTRLKCIVEEKEKQAVHDSETLRRRVLELEAFLQKTKQLRDIIEAMVQVHTGLADLRADMDVAEADHSFDELLVGELKEKTNDLCERVRELEQQLESKEGSILSKEDLGSEPDRLSLWQRFVRFFISGWRRRYASRDTLEHVEQWGGSQRGDAEEADSAGELCQHLQPEI